MEAERTAPRWPAWFAPAGFAGGLFITFVAVFLFVGAATLVDDSAEGSPLVNIVGTLLQDAAFLATAIALATLIARPVPADFGLRPPRVSGRRTLLWFAVVCAGFYAFLFTYSAVVEPKGEQDVLEVLGADRSAAYLLASAVLIVLVAPVVEEIFFRGFCYRALRNHFGRIWATLAIGLVFGSIHYSGPDTLLLLPPLAVLGVAFCLLYELTGSLYPAIALHVVNNAIALGATAESSAAPAVAGGLGLAALTGLIIVARRH